MNPPLAERSEGKGVAARFIAPGGGGRTRTHTGRLYARTEARGTPFATCVGERRWGRGRP